MIYQSQSVEETERFAGQLATDLARGDCIALEGELGAGKTQFVRGVVKGLGGEGRDVNSPTFVLLNVYSTKRFDVYHLDAYRVTGPADFEAIGFSELLDQGGIVIVEWAGRIASLLPQNRIDVQLLATGPTSRQIEITGWPTR